MSKFTDSLKHLGEMEVNDWDFMALLNKDIKEVEIAKSLRKLGDIRVMEWDFRTVLPAVERIAKHEVDLAGMLKRTANYKVMDWDFRKPLPTDRSPALQGVVAPAPPNTAEMQSLIVRLKGFLQYVAVNLIDEPNHAQIKVRQIAPNVLLVKMVLTKKDAAMLIGTEGHTAAAIRRIIKAAAKASGVHVLLQVQSHEEEIAEGGIS